MTKTERPVWFLGSYGVAVNTISIENSNGQQICINRGMTEQKGSKYEALLYVQVTSIVHSPSQKPLGI